MQTKQQILIAQTLTSKNLIISLNWKEMKQRKEMKTKMKKRMLESLVRELAVVDGTETNAVER